MALHVWTESIDALRFLARRCRLQRSRAGREDLITNVGSARGMQVQEWVSFRVFLPKASKTSPAGSAADAPRNLARLGPFCFFFLPRSGSSTLAACASGDGAYISAAMVRGARVCAAGSGNLCETGLAREWQFFVPRLGLAGRALPSRGRGRK